MRALGLMSGTSLDGIDAAIIETDGETELVPGPTLSVAYTPEERAVLRAALEVSKTWKPDEPMPAEVAEAASQIRWTLSKAQDTPLAIRDLERDDLAAD